MKWKKTLRGAILALSHFLLISPISVRRTAAVCCEWNRFRCFALLERFEFIPNSRCKTLVVWKTWNLAAMQFIKMRLFRSHCRSSSQLFSSFLWKDHSEQLVLLQLLVATIISPKGLYTYALRSHIRANLIQLRERAGVWATVKSALASMGITCTEGVFLFGNLFPITSFFSFLRKMHFVDETPRRSTRELKRTLFVLSFNEPRTKNKT